MTISKCHIYLSCFCTINLKWPTDGYQSFKGLMDVCIFFPLPSRKPKIFWSSLPYHWLFPQQIDSFHAILVSDVQHEKKKRVPLLIWWLGDVRIGHNVANIHEWTQTVWHKKYRYLKIVLSYTPSLAILLVSNISKSLWFVKIGTENEILPQIRMTTS